MVEPQQPELEANTYTRHLQHYLSVITEYTEAAKGIRLHLLQVGSAVKDVQKSIKEVEPHWSPHVNRLLQKLQSAIHEFDQAFQDQLQAIERGIEAETEIPAPFRAMAGSLHKEPPSPDSVPTASPPTLSEQADSIVLACKHMRLRIKEHRVAFVRIQLALKNVNGALADYKEARVRFDWIRYWCGYSCLRCRSPS